MGTARLIHTSLQTVEEGFKKTITALYRCANAETLDTVDLQVGNNLPADTTYEITAATLIQDRNSMDNVVSVSSFIEQLDTAIGNSAATGSNWSELLGTRKIISDTNEYRDWQIMFTGTTASTNPVNGDTYGSVVGVSAANFGDTSVYDVESVIVNATIDFRLTQNKSHAVCVFREQYLDTATR